MRDTIPSPSPSQPPAPAPSDSLAPGTPLAPTNTAPDADATRLSFLDRLRRMDPDSWEDLYRRYRQMIEARATQAGLGQADAEDVVQAVFSSVAKNPPGPSRRTGAFRTWICEQTRWRIFDKLRELGRQPTTANPTPGNDPEGSPFHALPADDEFTRQWDEEFARHIHDVAQRRIAAEISPEHFQIYQLTEEQGWPVSRVARQFQVAAATVYVIRHRVGSRLRAIAASILADLDAGRSPRTPENPPFR